MVFVKFYILNLSFKDDRLKNIPGIRERNIELPVNQGNWKKNKIPIKKI